MPIFAPESKAMSIESKQIEIIDEFSIFGDWMEKYEYIIELGKSLPLIQDSEKIDDNLIKGCQSRVWLHADVNENDKVVFTADSDAIITKGLIALMVRVLSEEPADSIAKADLHFIKDIGLDEHLSPTRSNGLVSMIKQMKMYGAAIALKSS